MIDRFKYPALNSILWDTQLDSVDEEYAFYMYEKRWKYITPSLISLDEQILIDHLILVYGKGLFLISE